MSRYRTSAFNQREYVTAAICKAYIFHRSELLNTEINITTFPKPLIKSALSVGLMEGKSSSAAYAAKKSDQTTAHTGEAVIQEVFPMVA